jgi:hypothetical protein
LSFQYDEDIYLESDMLIAPRCNYAGSLGKSIPTRTVSFLLARINPRLLGLLRW